MPTPSEYAEQSLLGAMIVRPQIVASVAEQVSEADFYPDRYRRLFATMAAMDREGAAIDYVTLADRLQLPAKDMAELVTLTEKCPPASNWPEYAAIVRREAINRELVSLGTGMAAGEITPEESEARLRILRERLETATPRKTISLREAVLELERHTREPMVQGLTFPWPETNRMLRGMRPGCLTYLGGYPGHGKTAAAVAIALHVAKSGQQVLFISLEMSHLEIAVRGAQRYGLDSERLYSGKPNDTDREAARMFRDWMEHDGHGNIEITWHRTVAEIERQVQRLSPDLVVLDYLQLMDIGSETIRVGTSKNSNALKSLARKHGVHVLALSQLSRPPRGETARAPGLHDLKESSTLEQDADGLLFVYREQEEGGRRLKDEGAFLVRKSRMGSTGMEEFIFDGRDQVFRLKTTDRNDWQQRKDLV